MKFIFASILLATSASASCGQSSGQYQDAQIQQSGEVPCFSVADNRETRGSPPILAVVSVYQRIAGRQQMVWSFDATKSDGDERLSPDNCIPYGRSLQASASRAQEVDLQTGVEYTVTINSHMPDDNKRSNRRYRGYFCLTKEASGKALIHQVKWDKRKEILGWGVCGL